MQLMKLLFDLLEENHPNLVNSGFAHVANVIELERNFEFDDELELRPANQNEVDTLSSVLQVARPILKQVRDPYATSIQCEQDGPDSRKSTIEPVAVNKGRYTVISFTGSNAKVHDVFTASAISNKRFIRGPEILGTPHGKGVQGGSSGFAQLLEELEWSDQPFNSLHVDDLNDIKDVFEKLKNPDVHQHVHDAIQRFTQLDAIPRRSPLRFLGMVAILESLITHAPKASDPYDSLTRQIRQKMLLIGRRSKLSIPYEIFEAATPDKAWTKLYGYRSAIAHGSTPDFKKEFAILKDHSTAFDFLEKSTVVLIRQMLEEPQLINDLRAC